MKRLTLFLVFISLLFSNTSGVFAQNNLKNAELAILAKDQTIDSDYFITGEKVVLSGTVNGDVYAAGGNITIDGIVRGDLLVAGGNIEITGSVNGNIRSAGGVINIRGTVGKNITAFGGVINVDRDARISGSLVAAGGNININSPIGRGLSLAGGNISISNRIGGSVNAAVGQLSLEYGAAIYGDINYMSDKEIYRAQGSTVSGKVIRTLPPEISKGPRQTAESLNSGFIIFRFLTSFLIGTLFLYFFPNFTQKTTDQISNKPGSSFLIGLIFLFVIPIIILLFMITIIGIPVGIILLVSYIFLLLFAHIFTSITLGSWVSKRLNFSSNSYLSLAFGLLLLSVLGFIPLIGWLVKLVAVMLGLGAYLIIKKDTFSQLRAKKAL